MSHENFRSHSSFPAMNQFDEEQFRIFNDDRYEEERAILSLSHADALNAVLCGINPDHASQGSKGLKEHEHSHIRHQEMDKNCNFINGQGDGNDIKINSHVNKNWECDSLEDPEEYSHEYLGSTSDDNVPRYKIRSAHSSRDIKSNETSLDGYLLPKRNLSSSKYVENTLKSANVPYYDILSPQTLKGDSPSTDSSSYLQDYLQLLTSRSQYSSSGKIKKESHISLVDSDHNLKGTNEVAAQKIFESNVMRSKSSSSSDISSMRSVGSTYLDSYLSNITDHSWIIYPTVKSSSASMNSGDSRKNSLTSNSSASKNLHRKLHFINPDNFFSVAPAKNKDHMTDTTNNFTQRDEASYTQPKDSVLLGNVISSEVTSKINTYVDISQMQSEIGKLQEAPLGKVDINSENTNDILKIKEIPVDVNILASDSRTDITDQLTAQLSSEGKSENDEASNEIEVSSSCSTNDQVSAIPNDASINNNQESDLNSENVTPRETSSDSTLNSDITQISAEESLVSRRSVSSLDPVTEESSVTHAIEILRAKQEQEIKELRKKQEEELNKFIYQISQLSTDQQMTLVMGCKPNSNGVSKNVNNNNIESTSSTMEKSVSTYSLQASSQTNDSLVSSPSFFLHERSDSNLSNDRQSDVNKISQLFSSSNLNLSKELTGNDNSKKNSMIGSQNEPPCSDNLNLRKEKTRRVMFSSNQLEVGLDLVPSRESDGQETHESLIPNSKQESGIIKLQALIRGWRIRRLMQTDKVQELLETLNEVGKMANQFHQDILTDNIRKGDIGFHRSLINQERQAREKLRHLLVEMTPQEQIEVIQRHKLVERSQKNKISSKTQIRPKYAENKNRQKKISFSSHKPRIPQRISESPRFIKSSNTASKESKTIKPLQINTGIPSRIPETRNQAMKPTPKRRITQRIDPKSSLTNANKRQNFPMCKATKTALEQDVKNVKKGQIPLSRDDNNERIKKLWR